MAISRQRIMKAVSEDHYVIFALILIVAALVRLAPLLRSGSDWAMWYDSGGYIQLADGLRSGCGFARRINNQCYPAEVVRTPGYPFLLALLPGARIAIAFQALLAVAVCALMAAFVRPRWGMWAAVTAALLFAIDLPSIHAGSQILSDSLFESLVALAILVELFATSSRHSSPQATCWALLCGGLIASAIMVRPIGLCLIVLGPIPFLIMKPATWRTRIRCGILVASIPLAVVLGWTARNTREAGVHTFSLIGTYNLYYYRAAALLVLERGGDFNAVQEQLAHEIGAERASPWVNVRFREQMMDRAEKIIMNDPVRYSIMIFQDFVVLLIAPERRPLNSSLEAVQVPGPARTISTLQTFRTSPGSAMRELFRREFDSSLVYLCLSILQLILTAFVLVGVILALRRCVRVSWHETQLILFLFGLSLILMLLAAGPEASARLRLPAVPLLDLIAAVGWFAADSGKSLLLDELDD
jgi:4-amino-4-deoxy-L-arabinose transferase-like glycosyltransferase